MKDPALLWYFNDWIGGTQLLNRHQKGCYMDLLAVQFNNGPLTLEEIKSLLGSDFGQWPNVQKKFAFMDGRYFNQRMEDEKSKRSKYTSSRRKNLSPHMEDININENKDTELPIWLNLKAWTAWEQHRKEKGQKMTPTSVRLQLKLLGENKEDHVQIIKNSITNGWTGLFALKENGLRKPNKYVEPNYDKETNERRNFLADQLKYKPN